MDYSTRLLTFYVDGLNGKSGGWPVAALRAEDMAGAGFSYTGTETAKDSVTCDACKLQAWRWEAKDDPFEEHAKGAPHCPYLTSSDFKDRHRLFLAKTPANATVGIVAQSMSPPETPVKKKRSPYKPRSRMGFSPIMTVYDSGPSTQLQQATLSQQGETKPVEIALTLGNKKIVIEVSDMGPRGTKRAREE